MLDIFEPHPLNLLNLCYSVYFEAYIFELSYNSCYIECFSNTIYWPIRNILFMKEKQFSQRNILWFNEENISLFTKYY